MLGFSFAKQVFLIVHFLLSEFGAWNHAHNLKNSKNKNAEFKEQNEEF
jgi:hypothetical protein